MLNVMGDFNYGKEIRLFDLFPVLRNKLLLITEKLANAYKNIFFSNFKVNVITILNANTIPRILTTVTS